MSADTRIATGGHQDEDLDPRRRAERGYAYEPFRLRGLSDRQGLPGDIKSQCGDEIKSGGAALKECMKKHFSDLSADCQVAIIRTASIGKACKADEKKLCADVKPGAMGACMRSHAADLSGDCKEALAKSSAK